MSISFFILYFSINVVKSNIHLTGKEGIMKNFIVFGCVFISLFMVTSVSADEFPLGHYVLTPGKNSVEVVVKVDSSEITDLDGFVWTGPYKAVSVGSGNYVIIDTYPCVTMELSDGRYLLSTDKNDWPIMIAAVTSGKNVSIFEKGNLWFYLWLGP